MISLFQRGSEVPGYKNRLSTNMCSPPDKFTSKLHVDCDSPIAYAEESKIINARRSVRNRDYKILSTSNAEGVDFLRLGKFLRRIAAIKRCIRPRQVWNGMQSTECNVARPLRAARRIARDIMVVPQPGKKADGNDERRRNEKLGRYSERCSVR